ncbi:NAD(P)H-dependent flavin oxidoreductase [Aliamphritea spongicola]|uniref:NAD(P)H-dependent flavin oxidoreductase n=1 Tax=Aliamphritea spongicola TaxID=707589 RepID=UPI00196AFE19|nr:nitronate monooxygenase [Aliamphritea spongicola]MBN3561655.1 nitronate monooxygenase [Aliamphritea spongicola]
MTDIRDLFDIELPVIQAPMAGVQGSALAVAVSNAGGLGSLPCAMLTPEVMATELEAIRAGTDLPVNVNFFAHDPLPVTDSQLQHWRERLQPYYDELGVDEEPAAGGRAPFNADHAAVLEAYRPEVVSFHFGLPDAGLLKRVRATGAKVIASATTLEEGRWLAEQGVDAIIAQGLEAGGHRGIFLTRNMDTQSGTFSLLPQLVAEVDVPVIAAGGICDQAGIRAAMQLGAAGVQMGTVYLLCDQTNTSALHRAALQDASLHTALTNVFSGGPARGIVNRAMLELGLVSPDAPPFPQATPALAPLRSAAEAAGSGDFSPLWSGQNRSGCRPVDAGLLTRELGADYIK